MEGQEGVTSPEGYVDRWEYEGQLKEYLVRLAEKGAAELEPIDQFPKRIELNNGWHETLNKLREETRDGLERWTPIGFRRRTRDFIFPSNFIIGTQDKIPGDAIYEGLENELVELGISHLIGEVHSHPGWGKRFIERFRRTGRIISEYRGFSPGDLHGIVLPSADFFFLYGVVDDRTNHFAFITKETEYLSPDSKLFERSEFENYWFYQYTRTKFHQKIPVSYPKIFRLRDVNIAVAERYRLALYNGESGGELIRSYP